MVLKLCDVISCISVICTDIWNSYYYRPVGASGAFCPSTSLCSLL